MKQIRVDPMDESNRLLVQHVHPPSWTNPVPAPCYDMVIVGAGTAGLVSAAASAGLGARTAIVERHLMGGDCLNVGCVPSKSIIRSSRAASDGAGGAPYGVSSPGDGSVDFTAVMERMRRIRAAIASHDSARRFFELGVDVYLGDARFTGRRTVEVNGAELRFKRAILATGARAIVLPVPGLEEARPLTNETVFSLTALPRRLAVIGGGPLGCEFAQAFRRLGAEVTVLERSGHLLVREDPDAAQIVQESFRRDGVEMLFDCVIERVESGGNEKRIHLKSGGESRTVAVDEILLGAGRAPNVEGIGLDLAGVRFDSRKGVEVNDHLRTSNRRIFAAGDCCLEHKFTHTADASARIAVQNALFFGRKRVSGLVVPWCTYTDPEIAHVGMYERDAREAGIPVQTFVKRFGDVDRAVIDGEADGLLKIHVRAGSDTMLGATLVSRHAGETISELTVAIASGTGLGRLSSAIHPYPTQAEAIRQLADEYNRTRLTPLVRWLLRMRLKLMR